MADDRARARNEAENESDDVEAHRFVSDEPGGDDAEKTRARARAKTRAQTDDESGDEFDRARA